MTSTLDPAVPAVPADGPDPTRARSIGGPGSVLTPDEVTAFITEALAAEIARRLALQAAGSMLPFASLDARGTPCGMTTYMNIDATNRRVEIGSTWTAARLQRGPFNTECKLLLLGHAFDALDCIAVEFRTHWHNLQSRAAIAGLGAKQDGVLRNHAIGRDGTLRDTVVFSIIAIEWPAIRTELRRRLAAH